MKKTRNMSYKAARRWLVKNDEDFGKILARTTLKPDYRLRLVEFANSVWAWLRNRGGYFHGRLQA